MQFEYKIMLHWQCDISPEHKAEAESLTNLFDSGERRGQTRPNNTASDLINSLHFKQSISCAVMSPLPNVPTSTSDLGT